MKEFSYDDNRAYIKLNYSNGGYDFKIDTGAFMTVVNKDEFKQFCPNKVLENGKEIPMSSASGTDMKGYIHKVSVYIVEFKESRFLDICFYDGIRALLGMETIRNNFKICFEKDKFSISLNE